jgi:hypothetical protein
MKTVSEWVMLTLYMSHNALSKEEVTASNEMCSRVTINPSSFSDSERRLLGLQNEPLINIGR